MKRIQNFKLFVPVLTVTLLSFSSCDKNKNTACDSCDNLFNNSLKDFEVPENSISFITGNNYFIKNTFENEEVQTLKIETREHFEKIFGLATLMGENGTPTEINFETQFVIAIIDIPSTKDNCMRPMYIRYEGDDLVLHYQKTIGEEITWTKKNKIISIVDKQFTGEVKSVVHY